MERRSASGLSSRKKMSKPERAALRQARSGDLAWRWPLKHDGYPLALEKLRDVVREHQERKGAPRLASDPLVAGYLRHHRSDYDRIIDRVGHYSVARQALRERIAEEIAERYPEIGDAARDAAGRESSRQRAASLRSENYRTGGEPL